MVTITAATVPEAVDLVIISGRLGNKIGRWDNDDSVGDCIFCIFMIKPSMRSYIRANNVRN